MNKPLLTLVFGLTLATHAINTHAAPCVSQFTGGRIVFNTDLRANPAQDNRASTTLQLVGLPGNALRLTISNPNLTLRKQKSRSNTLSITRWQWAQRSVNPDSGRLKLPTTGRMSPRLTALMSVPSSTPPGIYIGKTLIKAECAQGKEVLPLKVIATVSAPLTVSDLAPLNFGTLIVGRAQVKRINPNNPNAAVMKIQGAPGHRVKVLIKTPEIELRHQTNPYESLIVSSFRLGGDVNQNGVGTLPNQTGLLRNVRIGGALDVPATAEPGRYVGQGQIIVAYS